MKIYGKLILFGILAQLRFSAGGQLLADNFKWFWRYPDAPGLGLSCVAFGRDRFVAVGEGSTVLLSTTGRQWQRTSEIEKPFWFYDITFAKDQSPPGAVGVRPNLLVAGTSARSKNVNS